MKKKNKTTPAVPFIASREVIEQLPMLYRMAAEAAIEAGYWVLQDDKEKPEQKPERKDEKPKR